MSNKKNLATATIASAPTPNTSGVTMILSSGQGTRFPTAPFYITVFPDGQLPTFDNAEIMKVISKAGDTLTVVRSQRSTNPQPVDTTYRVVNAIYVEDIPNQTTAEEFGAIGDGVIDDTSALQSAINSLNANGGGILSLAPRTYKITSSLIVYSHITIQGSGDGAVDGSGGGMGTASSTILQSSTSANGLTGVDVIDFNLNQVAVTGPGSGTADGVNLSLNFHGDSRYIHFTDATVQNFGRDNISIDTLIISHFDRVVGYGAGRYNWNLHASGVSAATSTMFNSCWSHNGGDDGWHIDHMVYSSFINCGSDVNDGKGYSVTNSQSISLIACGAESNTGESFHVDSESYNITAISCWSFQSDNIAFHVTGNSQSINIVGFHENSPTIDATASIQVDSGSTAIVSGFFVITATNFASGTTSILSDGSGNMTIPGTFITAMQARASDFENTNINGSYTVNSHYDSGWKYIGDGAAFLMNSDGAGGMYFYSAPSGSAGASITFTERMHITTSGVEAAALKITGGTPGSGKVLTSDASGNATWQTASAGFANPMTASGDIIYGGSSGTPTRLAKSTDGKVLTLASGLPSWATPGSSGISPGTLTGIIVAASDAPADWLSAATYTCDGTADNSEIASAITAAKSDGRKIYLSPGTFNIASTITISGDDITDSDNSISLLGSGAYQTNLVAGTNITLIKLTDSCKVNISDIMLNVNGSGAGIQSRAVTTSDPYRSFWASSFKNILIRGNSNQTDHTGWAMDLGSPFRSTFENIEAYNVKNGIKLFSENAAFNPGDCTFIRCFMELGTNSGGIGYYLNGDPAVMNHCMFINCEAFAYGTTATGIKMDGTTGTMWNNFIGTNLEQFTTVVDIVSGEGNNISCNYIAGRDGVTSTIFKTEAAAYNNRLQAGFAYLNVSGTIWSDANTNTPTQPNYVHDTKLYCDTGATATLTTVASSGFSGNTFDGAGTMPTAWKNTVLPDGVNYGFGTTTGTMIGTSTTQKIGFFGATPVVQQGVGADLGVLLASLGLRASGSTYTIATSGAVGFTGAFRLSAATITSGTTLATTSVPIQYSNSSSALTHTLPATTTTGYFFFIKNINTGLVTVSATSIDGAASVYLGQDEGILVASTTTSGTWRVLARVQNGVRTQTIASSATPAINTDITDEFTITALAAAITSMTTNLTGTPKNGQKLVIRIKDNATARAITWGASFVSSGVATLLATTSVSKTHQIFLKYDSTAAKWVCMAVDATGY